LDATTAQTSVADANITAPTSAFYAKFVALLKNNDSTSLSSAIGRCLLTRITRLRDLSTIVSTSY
jgi:hypothetical protein